MHGRYLLLVFMIIAIVVAGVFGFSRFEGFSVADSFHVTIAALTFSGGSSSFSSQGRLLDTSLAVASVAVIVWAFVNFHRHSSPIPQDVDDYFRFMPPDEGLVLKVVKASSGNGLAGRTKLAILKGTGSVVFGVAKNGFFELDVPMTKRIPKNSGVLLLGNVVQLKKLGK